MSLPRPSGKRGLREVLQAGVTHEETRDAEATGVLYDVCTSAGELFGQCITSRDGRHVYVKPSQLWGVEVVLPMAVRPHPNTACLAAALTQTLCSELSR